MTTARTLTIAQSRIDQYNRVGVLIDGATNDASPVTRVGHRPTAASSPTTRSSAGCSARTSTATGNCTDSGSPGNQPDHDRPAVRPGRRPRDARGASAALTGNTISQNLVSGAARRARRRPTNNANLSQARRHPARRRAGLVRDAQQHRRQRLRRRSTPSSTAPRRTRACRSRPRTTGGACGPAPVRTLPNAGPAISPTTNPPFPENPVNGFARHDGAGTSSTRGRLLPVPQRARRATARTASSPSSTPRCRWTTPPRRSAVAPTRRSPAQGRDGHADRHAGDDFGVKRVTVLRRRRAARHGHARRRTSTRSRCPRTRRAPSTR